MYVCAASVCRSAALCCVPVITLYVCLCRGPAAAQKVPSLGLSVGRPGATSKPDNKKKGRKRKVMIFIAIHNQEWFEPHTEELRRDRARLGWFLAAPVF